MTPGLASIVYQKPEKIRLSIRRLEEDVITAFSYAKAAEKKIIISYPHPLRTACELQ